MNHRRDSLTQFSFFLVGKRQIFFSTITAIFFIGVASFKCGVALLLLLPIIFFRWSEKIGQSMPQIQVLRTERRRGVSVWTKRKKKHFFFLRLFLHHSEKVATTFVTQRTYYELKLDYLKYQALNGGGREGGPFQITHSRESLTHSLSLHKRFTGRMCRYAPNTLLKDKRPKEFVISLWILYFGNKQINDTKGVQNKQNLFVWKIDFEKMFCYYWCCCCCGAR